MKTARSYSGGEPSAAAISWLVCCATWICVQKSAWIRAISFLRFSVFQITLRDSLLLKYIAWFTSPREHSWFSSTRSTLLRILPFTVLTFGAILLVQSLLWGFILLNSPLQRIGASRSFYRSQIATGPVILLGSLFSPIPFLIVVFLGC